MVLLLINMGIVASHDARNEVAYVSIESERRDIVVKRGTKSVCGLALLTLLAQCRMTLTACSSCWAQ